MNAVWVTVVNAVWVTAVNAVWVAAANEVSRHGAQACAHARTKWMAARA